MTLARANQFLQNASAMIRLACGGQDLEETAGRQEEFAGSDDTDIFLSQRPVTAVSSVTIDSVVFTDYTWTRWGTITRDDLGSWTEGPILVTYDSGYAAASDEMAMFKSVCLEVAGRAMTTSPNDTGTFGEVIPEARGWAPTVFLTPQEIAQLADYGPVPVG